MLIEIFFLALGSMVWPVLLAVDVVAFKSDRPVTILGGFLAGGLLATVSVGCAIVFSLQHTSLVTTSKHTFDSTVYIVVGAAALVAALFIRRSDRQRRAKPKAEPHASSRVDRLAGQGAWLAFVTGIVLNLFPGVLPFIALKDIGELDYSIAGTVAVIVAFYLVMFVPVEAPLIAFLVAPERTERAVDRFNVWLSANARKLAWWALAIFGAFELVRGIVLAS
jgi:Sap, sulfolipid-1-addressing protein